jgi:aldehyde:ferredoxin oxidoreductase
MRASAKLGRGSEKWAVHSKGLELSGYDPRRAEDQALWFAVGLQAQSDSCFPCWVLDHDSASDSNLSNQEREDLAAIFESLMICGLMRGCFQDFLSEAAHLYALATGIKLSPDELKQAGERINNLKKAFNIREGWKRTDDWLPPRLFEEGVSSGKETRNLLSEKRLQAMIDAYYEARGWTPKGLIPIEKFNALGMDDILETVKGT